MPSSSPSQAPVRSIFAASYVIGFFTQSAPMTALATWLATAVAEDDAELAATVAGGTDEGFAFAVAGVGDDETTAVEPHPTATRQQNESSRRARPFIVGFLAFIC